MPRLDLRQAVKLLLFQHGSMDRLIIFRCPATGLDVQTSLPLNRGGTIVVAPGSRGEDNERRYEGLTCPACSRLHFINRKTGKLLGGRE